MKFTPPEPAAHLADGLPLFTESQLLQVRREAIEECADICQTELLRGLEKNWHETVVCAEHLKFSIKDLK